MVVPLYILWTYTLNPQPAAEPRATPVARATPVPAALNAAGIPAQLGALKLTGSVTGTGALAEFAQLHGKGFDLLGGYRADYRAGDSRGTLWVAQTKDAAAAQAMLDDMARKIGPNNAMFTDLQQMNIGGRVLYSAEGQGQQHFFYARNDKLVWFAADPAQAADAFHALWAAVQ
jgi:hypothetical protein